MKNPIIVFLAALTLGLCISLTLSCGGGGFKHLVYYTWHGECLADNND